MYSITLGAAGRDRHNFNVVYRNDHAGRVVAFTAARIPGIAGRRYPGSLACHLSAIVVLQIANVFLHRSASRSILSTGILGNRLLLAGMALELTLLLAINYTPWSNALPGTAPLTGVVWLFIAPSALTMLGLAELRKWIVRTAADRKHERYS